MLPETGNLLADKCECNFCFLFISPSSDFVMRYLDSWIYCIIELEFYK